MPAEVIQSQYDELKKVADRFGRQAEAQKQLQQRVARSMSALQSGWQGKGSAAFFAEMNGKVLPTIGRLHGAMQQARTVTLELQALVRQAEEEAANVFKQGKLAGPMLGGEPPVQAGKIGDGVRISGYNKVTNGQPFVGGAGDTQTRTIQLPKWLGGKTITVTTGDIHPNDIAQGQLGDCFLASSLAVVAKQNPNLIRNAVRDNGDGTYTVTFFDNGKAVPIKVTPEFPTGEKYLKKEDKWVPIQPPHIGKGDSAGGKEELWPRLIEKAYGQWKGGGDADRGYASLNKGGHTADVLAALSGSPSRVESPAHFNMKQLAEMQQGGQAITFSSLPGDKNKDSWYRDGSLVRGHAYWVESVDEKAGTVTLRNPWGYEDSKSHKIVVPHNELNKYFNRVTVNPLRK